MRIVARNSDHLKPPAADVTEVSTTEIYSEGKMVAIATEELVTGHLVLITVADPEWSEILTRLGYTKESKDV